MPIQELSYLLVFLAGMVSFLSPCVLPIVPAYLSLISGLSFEELETSHVLPQTRRRLLWSALAFIGGFSLVVIVVLGGLASLLTTMPPAWRVMVRWIGGGVVIVFALHMLGLFRIPWLFRERRFHVQSRGMGMLGAALVGAAFAFGWSPCIGPILSGVLTYASGTATPAQAWGLLVAYTFGLAVPFLLAALFIRIFLDRLRTWTRHLRTIEIGAGVLLLVMGVLLLTNHLTIISQHSEVLYSIYERVERLLW